MRQTVDFSTDGLSHHVSDAARFAVWEDWAAENLRGFEWSRHVDTPYAISVKRRAFPRLAVGKLSGTLSQTTRGPRQIAADSRDQLVLAAVRSASPMQVRQRGRVLDDAARGVFLVSDTEPHSMSTDQAGSEWFNVMLPAKAVLARAPMAEDFLARRLLDPAGVLGLLLGYAEALLAQPGLDDPRAAELAADHCLDLAVLALGARSHEAEAARLGGLRAVRLKAVLSRISRDFAEPDLSVDAIATGLKLSSRYVHALLQETGKGFTERVLTLRLDEALRLLTRERPSRVSQAAFAVGFNDLSYFNRCFRRRYGMTPTGARGRPDG